ncbi:MAG: hypothetical protein SGPRY_004938 [Prymnesium sp.]
MASSQHLLFTSTSPRTSPVNSSRMGPYTTSPHFAQPEPLAPIKSHSPHPPERTLSSNLQTGFNILNNYVGLVLLSISYTFKLAGWLNLSLLGLLTAFGAYTGKQAPTSTTPPKGRVVAEGKIVPSYAGIGERCLGSFGKWLVLGSSIFETFVAVLCMNIIIWNNVALLLPNVSLSWIIAGCILISLPANWLKDFTMLSFLSVVGMAFILIICLVVGYDVIRERDGHAVEREFAVPMGIPMASSILMAGLTGHVGLPPLYSEMKKPSDFEKT